MTDTGENKNLEPQFNEEQLFRDIAGIVVIRGELNEPDDSREYDSELRTRTSEDGRSFVLRNLPPLTEAGISEIEFVPEFTYEGERHDSTLHVRFDDEQLDKTVVLTQLKDGRMDVQAIVDPKVEEAHTAAPDAWEDFIVDTAIHNVFNEQQSDDPEIAGYEDKIFFMLAQDHTPSPEDMLAIEDAGRRLKKWFAS